MAHPVHVRYTHHDINPSGVAAEDLDDCSRRTEHATCEEEDRNGQKKELPAFVSVADQD